MDMFNKTKAAGNKVRDLKKAKAAKDEVTAAVNDLLSLKKEYKSLTGQDYDANKPPTASPTTQPSSSTASSNSNANMDIFNKTKAAGDKVRDLKTAKAPKDQVTAAVNELLSRKKQYKETVGSEYNASKPPSADAKPTQSAPQKSQPKPKKSREIQSRSRKNTFER